MAASEIGFKGGMTFLLSYLFFLQFAIGQSGLLVHNHIDSKKFGQVNSPILSENTIEKLKSVDLAFDDWTSFFTIKVKGGNNPVLGTYKIEENRILFIPRFLPDSKVIYSITFSSKSLFERIGTKPEYQYELSEEVRFEIPSVQPLGIKLLPNSKTLPENILRVYLYFTSPMGFQNPYNYLQLKDSTDQIIEDAFVEIPEGLWNSDRTRLTLLFHPGRVKRKVGPNRKKGPVFRSGGTYQLVVKKDLRDANGNSLLEDWKIHFTITDPIRTKMSIDEWQMTTSCQNNCYLELKTDRLIDSEMMQRFLRIEDENAGAIPFEIKNEIEQITIHSNQFKIGSSYQLIVNPRLEDLCGNTFLNAFDYPIGQREDAVDLVIFSFDFKP